MIRAPVALLFACILSNPTHPQEPSQETPVFRTEVNFIEVDAIVVGPDGGFVSDLSQNDFEILEDGIPQEIASFRLVLIPQHSVAAVEPETVPIEPGLAKVPWTVKGLSDVEG